MILPIRKRKSKMMASVIKILLIFIFVYANYKVYEKLNNKYTTKKYILTPSKKFSNIWSKQKGLGEQCSNRLSWKNQGYSIFTKNLALYSNSNKVPPWNDTIYFEWYNTRIRVNSDKMMWNRIRPLKELVQIECIEYNGKFIKKIEEHLTEIALQKSWAFSAHDKKFDYYNGKYFVELHSGKYYKFII